MDSGSDRKSNMPTSLQYRRLRAPSKHGQTLQDPPLESAKKIIRENLEANAGDVLIGDTRLGELRKLGRREVFELACLHTSSYRNVSLFAGSAQTNRQIVMSGHQPRLFHPGVWYKNFALSSLSSNLNCTAINLVVDNDICGVAAIKVPEFRNGEAAFGLLPIDTPGDNVPFEDRQIEDHTIFDSFASRVSAAIETWVKQPIVNQLWKLATEIRKADNRLGHTLAASRHAMELDFGLQTLEVPLSQVAQTRAFALFVKHLLMNLPSFQSVHNASLNDYRRIHKIRSRSHPVPPLESDDQWLEAPLWIWNTHDPIRGRLFVRVLKDTISLSNRRDIQLDLETKNFVDQFSELTRRQNMAVRPRALGTTMFARTVLSDLFLHGIGGAKYDHLTDAIIENFLGMRPPRFMTLTATMGLPVESEIANPTELSRIKNQLRELAFHPETQLRNSDPASVEIVARKRHWIESNLPKGHRLERHRAIEKCNDLLQPYVQSQREQLTSSLAETSKKIRTGQILDSREFSFCLFPAELMQQLRSLSQP